MIPLSDSTPRRSTPWVNYLIIAACLLVFLIELSLGPRLDAFVNRYGVTPRSITAALEGNSRAPEAALITLVTALFLHAGWLHILGNLLFLWIFGDNVEDRVGHFKYLLFYLFCGVGANLAQVLADPTSSVPLIGASGAIAGVLGAYLVLYPRAWVTVLVPILFILWPISVPVVIVLGVWFLTQLGNGVMAITEASQVSGGVGYWAHIGGFVLGMLLINVFPVAPPSARIPRGRLEAPGYPRWLHGILATVGNVVTLGIVARLAFTILLPQTSGAVRAVEFVVVGLTNPLVLPFARFVPAIQLNGTVVELYALLALLVYQLLLALLIWILGHLFGSSPPRPYYR